MRLRKVTQLTMFLTADKNRIIRKIDNDSLKIAKNYVLNNLLVAFPTETVYGLGANAFNDEAIRMVYAAKGRPLDNPIIVHVHSDYDITRLVYDDRPYTAVLRKVFLPGPLTIVYKSKGVVSPLVSCGLDTLAVRVPSSEAAQRFLKYVDIPVAAPSANISKHTSPVTAEHVFNDFGNRIPLILDGGRCTGGIESTVVDVTGEFPVILRKGLVTAEMIAEVVGKCEYAADNSELNKRSPGTKYRHYCPKTKTSLFASDDIEGARRLYLDSVAGGLNPLIMCVENVKPLFAGFNVFSLGETGSEMAARLYYGLRESEAYDLLIGIRFEVTDEVMLSVENRFLKAFG